MPLVNSFRRARLARALNITLAAAVLAVVMSASTQAQANETVRAMWRVQQIDFPYFGLTTHYSCDGLRDKMRSILNELSVREDYLVRIGCTEISGVERSPSVNIVVATPVPASDELSKAFASDPNRAKLLASLQRKGKTALSDAPFDAVQKHVVLNVKDRSNSSGAGDCELLEHVRDRLLPKLGAKVVKDEVRCTPHQGVVGNPKLEVELLTAVALK